MDISDRIESRDLLVAMPERVAVAIREWIAELLRRAAGRDGVVEAVGLRDALLTRSLRPAPLAALAEGAAGWLNERRPEDSADAAQVERELLELRDRARSLVPKRDTLSAVRTIEPALRDLLRSQTLVILEFAHERWEDARDLPPSELLTVAAIFRDALAVLDTIGWLAGEHDAIPAEVPITAGHVAQLRWLRDDVAMSVVTNLEGRDDLADPDDIAAVDQDIQTARDVVRDLWRIIQAPGEEA
jgi:hypothetical protein